MRANLVGCREVRESTKSNRFDFLYSFCETDNGGVEFIDQIINTNHFAINSPDRKSGLHWGILSLFIDRTGNYNSVRASITVWRGNAVTLFHHFFNSISNRQRQKDKGQVKVVVSPPKCQLFRAAEIPREKIASPPKFNWVFSAFSRNYSLLFAAFRVFLHPFITIIFTLNSFGRLSSFFFLAFAVAFEQWK